MDNSIRKPGTWLYQLAVERCSQLTEHLLILERRTAYSEAAMAIVNLVRATIRTLSQELDSLDPSPGVVDGSYDRLKEIHDLLSYLSEEVTRLLEGAAEEDVPGELIGPIQRFADIVAPGAKVLLNAIPDVNYVYQEAAGKIRDYYRRKGLSSVISDSGFPEQLIVLSLSNVPPLGVLTHTSLAHEFGHAVWEIKGADKEFSIELDNVDVALPHKASDWAEKLLAEEHLHDVVSNWIEELTCDIIALSLAGPSYLFGLVYFMLPTEEAPELGSDDHPPVVYRSKLALRVLKERLGYENSPVAQLNEALNMIDEYLSSFGPANDEPVYDAALQSMSQIEDQIIDLGLQLATPHEYSPDVFAKEVPPLMDRICRGVLPNEYWDSGSNSYSRANLWSIFGAGWLVFIIRWEEWEALLPVAKRRNIRFDRLLAYAVDCSDLPTRGQGPDGST